MIDWRIVLLAFLLGMFGLFLLEARPRRWRGWGFVSGMLLVGTAVLWLLGGMLRPPKLSEPLPIASFADVQVQVTVFARDVSTLPPPVISISAPAPTVQAVTPTPVPVLQPAILSIPDLDVRATIVDVPLQDGTWDVDNLGADVGRLAGVGQRPGDPLAMAFAGHMTFPSSRNVVQGAFANLQYAIYGTELFLEINGERLVYEVVEISRVAPDAVDKLVVEDGDSILLVTCTDWDENGRYYANRLLVRAERVESAEG